MRDHGGNLDWAMARWGGARGDWVDLSTGINPVPYPVAPLTQHAWTALPTRADLAGLAAAARDCYKTTASVLPLAGAQAGLQLAPFCAPIGDARILAPTYNEHRAAFEAAGWAVRDCADLAGLAGSDAAVLVNPNNPDGQTHRPETVRALAKQVGLLVVDESFADPVPELSIAGEIPENAVVLRSFGKFFGLAGVRLGFALGAEAMISRMRAFAGPWPVSGAAIEIGVAALGDQHWQTQTIERLCADRDRLDGLARAAGWTVLGGADLFRLYEVPDSIAVQARLAEAQVWSRVFPYAPNWLRLGLPGPLDWAQVERAMQP